MPRVARAGRFDTDTPYGRSDAKEKQLNLVTKARLARHKRISGTIVPPVTHRGNPATPFAHYSKKDSS
jgi:hypothetical protein